MHIEDIFAEVGGEVFLHRSLFIGPVKEVWADK